MLTNEELIDKYGPLLTINSAAKILDRSPDGFRVSLHRSDPMTNKLKAIKIHIGRRVYFPTSEFFKIILEKKEANND